MHRGDRPKTVRSDTGRTIALLGLLLGAQACAPTTPTPGPLTSSPTGQPSIALPSREELDKARQFRQAFGLRADDAWLINVAANPASEPARIELGVPLLPSEFQDFLSRVDRAQAVLPFLETYGAAYPDVWGGAFIDQPAGGAVAMLFTDDVDLHRERLMRVLPEGSKVVVREAAWSLRDLAAFTARVKDDVPWFATIGTELYAVDLIEQQNQIRIRFLGPEPGAAQAIASHYGNESWFFTKWIDSGWTGPLGGLDVLVQSIDGRPLPDMRCVPQTTVPAAMSDIASVSKADGRCIFRRLPAVDYEIEIQAPVGDEDVLVGRVSAKVTDGALTVLRVQVRLPE
jgi:hypothetical protein